MQRSKSRMARRNPRIVQIGRGQGAPSEQNVVKQFTVFGSVKHLNAFADAACKVIFRHDEVELDGVDRNGGHFKVAGWQEDGFRALAAQYGLQVSEVRV